MLGSSWAPCSKFESCAYDITEKILALRREYGNIVYSPKGPGTQEVELQGPNAIILKVFGP